MCVNYAGHSSVKKRAPWGYGAASLPFNISFERSMAAGSAQQAKRTFVKVLLTIAALYSVWLNITRDSPDEDCSTAFEKLLLKVHPDKGGLVTRAQALNSAKETWDKARCKGSRGGRPASQKAGGARSTGIAEESLQRMCAPRIAKQEGAGRGQVAGEFLAEGVPRSAGEEGSSHRFPKVTCSAQICCFTFPCVQNTCATHSHTYVLTLCHLKP